MKTISRLTSFVLVVALMLTFVYTTSATENPASNGPMVEVNTVKVNENVFKIEVSVRDVQDLYGMSMDMTFDETIFEVVDHQGNILWDEPVITPESFFGADIDEATKTVMASIYGDASSADSFVAINQIANEKQIQFAKLLSGAREGVDISGKSVFAYLYLRVKEGQVAPNGYGVFGVTQDVKAAVLDNALICVKLANHEAQYISYTQYHEATEVVGTVKVVDISRHMGDKEVASTIVLTMVDTTTMTYPVTLKFEGFEAQVQIALPLNLQGGETLWTAIDDYKIKKYDLVTFDGQFPVGAQMSMKYGDLNGDDKIDEADVAQLHQRYVTGQGTLFDILKLGQSYEGTVAP